MAAELGTRGAGARAEHVGFRNTRPRMCPNASRWALPTDDTAERYGLSWLPLPLGLVRQPLRLGLQPGDLPLQLRPLLLELIDCELMNRIIRSGRTGSVS